MRQSYELADAAADPSSGSSRRGGRKSGGRGPRLRPVVRPLPGNQDSDLTMISRNCGDDDVCVPDIRLETAL